MTFNNKSQLLLSDTLGVFWSVVTKDPCKYFLAGGSTVLYCTVKCDDIKHGLGPLEREENVIAQCYCSNYFPFKLFSVLLVKRV